MSAVEQSSPWTVGAFLKWQTRQDDRYELVGGFPVKLMTGASRRHDRIVIDLGHRLVIPVIIFVDAAHQHGGPASKRAAHVGRQIGERHSEASVI